MTYLATAGPKTPVATTDDIGDIWKQLAPCCEGPNVYIARADCQGVSCYTKDRALVEQWRTCIAEKRNDTVGNAYKIDYGYLKTGKISGASSLVTKTGLLLTCIVGVSFILGS